jgi:hypothetical protein
MSSREQWETPRRGHSRGLCWAGRGRGRGHCGREKQPLLRLFGLKIIETQLKMPYMKIKTEKENVLTHGMDKVKVKLPGRESPLAPVLAAFSEVALMLALTLSEL